MFSESQSEKFKRLARELECDESEEAFDEALGRVVAPRDHADDVLLIDVEVCEGGFRFSNHRWASDGEN